MTKTNMEKALEAAARALCRFNGNPENIGYQGGAMWESYLPEATAAVEAALPYLMGAQKSPPG